MAALLADESVVWKAVLMAAQRDVYLVDSKAVLRVGAMVVPLVCERVGMMVVETVV